MRNVKQDKLLVILGPTASGKTSLAINVARETGGEIICADSRTIYRGMNIGTAKPKQKKLAGQDGVSMVQGIRHYGLDIADIGQAFSVADFQRHAGLWIKKIISRGKLPILVGGTGLYIQAVVDGLDIPPESYEKKVRDKFQKKDLAALIKSLEDMDPQALQMVDLKNKRRVIRALEICILTGRPFSEQRSKSQTVRDVLQIGLSTPREELYSRIEQRVDEMMNSGLLEEVRGLLKKYPADSAALSALGYKQLIEHLSGRISLEEAVELIKRDTRRYAKRQMTWFRKDERIIWAGPDEVSDIVEKWLAK